jgi:GH25 family lysozyme M1 (1,4-beta-N-acetylmuramidase)
LPQLGTEAPASAGPAQSQPAAGASSAAATPAAPEANLYISGIDVSHHNGDIDFRRVRDAGYEFVFLKTTQDNDFIDPMFVTNLARARAAGLAAGGYHFFDYTLDGDVQADHFIDRLEVAGGLADALPPVVDVECWSPIGLSIHAVSTARLRDLVERIYERTGRMPIVYTSVFMWKEVVGNAEGFEDLPLWAACWDCETPPSIAPGWEDWTFWQTGIDRIPGVGSLDGNYFSGDPDDLDALRLRPLAIESGAAATSSQEVEIDLGGRSGTHLRTSPDGRTWSRWTPIRGTPRAELGSTDGSHTLHVQLRDGREVKSPVFSDAITLDTRGPQLSTPTIRLRLAPLGEGAAISEAPDVDDAIASPTADDAATLPSAPSPGPGGAGAGIPIEVGWEASDAVAGLSGASLSIDCDGDRAASIDAPGSAEPGQLMTWSAPAVVAPDTRCRVTVTGRDGVGNATRTRADTVVATVIAAAGDGSSGASVEGRQVGIIARRGPDRGRAAVRVDGEAIGLVDLYAPSTGEAEVVHVVDLVPGVPASITLEATGTSHPDSTGTAIAIDGLVTLASD